MTRQAAHRAQCVKSPIDLDASLAAGSSGRDSEASLQFVMKAVPRPRWGPGSEKNIF